MKKIIATIIFVGSLFTLTNVSQASEVTWGKYQPYGHHVTISKKHYGVFQDKKFKKKVCTTKDLYQKTFYAKGYYFLSDDSYYLSLYDNDDNWIGYVRSTAMTKAESRAGLAIFNGTTVKIVKKDYPLWANFKFNSKKHMSNEYMNKKLYAKYTYNHVNGCTYYSLYDKPNGNWLGYINEKGATKLNLYSETPEGKILIKYKELLANHGWKGKWFTNNELFLKSDNRYRTSVRTTYQTYYHEPYNEMYGSSIKFDKDFSEEMAKKLLFNTSVKINNYINDYIKLEFQYDEISDNYVIVKHYLWN